MSSAFCWSLLDFYRMCNKLEFYKMCCGTYRWWWWEWASTKTTTKRSSGAWCGGRCGRASPRCPWRLQARWPWACAPASLGTWSPRAQPTWSSFLCTRCWGPRWCSITAPRSTSASRSLFCPLGLDEPMGHETLQTFTKRAQHIFYFLQRVARFRDVQGYSWLSWIYRTPNRKFYIYTKIILFWLVPPWNAFKAT